MKTYVKNLFGRITVKILIVQPGAHLSDQRHQNRSEWWKVLSGVAVIELEQVGKAPQIITLKPIQTVSIPQGTWHRLGCAAAATTPVKVLEISTGHFDEEDIERRADDYGRAS